jgi:hypothetical protein
LFSEKVLGCGQELIGNQPPLIQYIRGHPNDANYPKALSAKIIVPIKIDNNNTPKIVSVVSVISSSA